MSLQFETMKATRQAVSIAYRKTLNEIKTKYRNDFHFYRSNPSLIAVDKDGCRNEKLDPIYYSGSIAKVTILELAAQADVFEIWYDNSIDGSRNIQFDECRIEKNALGHDHTPVENNLGIAELLVWKKD